VVKLGLLSLLLLLSTAVLSAAQARECRGVNFPDQIQVGDVNLNLNGLGVRKATFLKVNVYVAALYVAQPPRDARALIQSTGPDQLVLHFVRDVGVGDLRTAWSEGFANNAKDQLAALQPRIEKLNSWMTDMKSGQRLTFMRRPDTGVEIDVNGTHKGVIEGDDFARALLAIWLGDAPPNPELKNGLLGQECK
jgi:hypothetical protein